jgi:Fur family transcriptional regulator, peroxide stress response regulator
LAAINMQTPRCERFHMNNTTVEGTNQILREALDASGHRFTEQRAAVYRYLVDTTSHPTAEDVFLQVRSRVPGISLATVYKSLETLVGCRLAVKLSHADGSARYDGRTDPHYHARCIACGKVSDISGHLGDKQVSALENRAGGFTVVGYHLELTGYCTACASAGSL